MFFLSEYLSASFHPSFFFIPSFSLKGVAASICMIVTCIVIDNLVSIDFLQQALQLVELQHLLSFRN